MVTVNESRVALDTLKHDPKNARKHSERNLEMISHSLQAFGATRGIVIDEDGTVLAGNGVLEAAKQAGIENIRVVESDGREIVAIKVSHLTPEQKAQYAIADNRTTDLSEWDTESIQSLIDEGVDLSAFWYETELDRLLMADADLEFNPADEWEGMPEYEQEAMKPVAQVMVTFLTEQDVDDFSEAIGQTVTLKTKGITYPQNRANFRDSAYVANGSDHAS
jgi:hypothetical protein